MADSSGVVATCTRTLLASGYVITGSTRQLRHIEISCQRRSAIGAEIRFLVAITDEPEFSLSELEELRHVAGRQGRALALVASEPGPEHLAASEFLDALGGAIPSWRALTPEFAAWLKTAAANVIPAGLVGEPWQLFEDLAADGLEFLFGRRVQRMGGRRRGRAVSDMLAQMPDLAMLVIDTKAAAKPFDVSTETLRALGEYVRVQRLRQSGHNEVFSALLVSSGFLQERARLQKISLSFYADWGLPISMLLADDLAALVERMKDRPTLRNAIRWRHVFRGGLVERATIAEEVDRAADGRYGGTD
jgi:hypothetical protein